jgi:hypothetical protein
MAERLALHADEAFAVIKPGRQISEVQSRNWSTPKRVSPAHESEK